MEISDERKIERKNLRYYVEVFNRDTDELIGRMVDITKDGIRLFCKQPIDTSTVYPMRMNLPKSCEGSEQVVFDANSIWCKPKTSDHGLTDYYDTGYQMMNLSVEDAQNIQSLIEEYSSDL